ncbi:Leucine-rich repeat, ribonuclease inhibitor subtype, partial [Cynara cardunculus var. scolymus]
LWPPSQTTRQVLVDRIVKNLTTPSILSRKYGLLSKEEAEEDAKQIESAAFSAANQHFEKEPDSDGASTVQVYARESSKLMVEVVKRGPRPKEDRDIIPDLLSDHESVFDISGGRRAFIDAEEAKELLKPLKEPENKYTKICFSNRSFGLPAAHVAASILSNLKNQLTEVDLSDFVSRRPEPEAIEVMRMFSSALEGCDLSYLNLSNNTLGERGIRAFGDLLRSQENLVELYLMNAGGVALAEALATCTLLKKLDLRDNVFGTEAGIALSRGLSGHANLIEIHLGHLNLEDEAAIAILNALETCPSSIEALEMAGNAITSEAAPAIAACITSKKDSLTKLNLSENELKDAGAVAIGRAVAVEEEFGRLMMVDLSSNGIGSGGARILAKAVAGKPVFRLLNINGNFISNKGIEDVREIFQNSPRMLGPLDANNPDGEDDD